MRRTPGTIISAGGHVVLLVWLLSGWGLSSEPLDFEVTDVQVISTEEFEALLAGPETSTPDPDPAAEAALEELAALEDATDIAAPEPPSEPESAPEPPAPETVPDPAPEQPAQPEAPVEDTPPPPAPEPPPEVAEVEDVAPAPLDPPQPEAEIAPDPVVAPPPSTPLESALRPQARPAPRVAPEAAPAPEPDVEIAPEVAESVQPEEIPDPIVEEDPPETDTAPEEATTEIVTEADEPSGAVLSALRPRTRPDRPAAPATPAASDGAPADAPANAPAAAQNDGGGVTSDIDDLLADVLDGGDGGAASAADPGPPLTQGEQDAFRLAVQTCWVVDPGSAAAQVTVTVAFSLTPDGRVESNEVALIGSSGGSQDAVRTAFRSARRAILRCQSDGFPLPAEKYAQWRLVEMSFNPDGMRIR